LLKNHLSRLTSFTPFLEVNETSFDNYSRNNGRGVDVVGIEGTYLKYSKKEYHTLSPKVELQ
jgi:hypothetical protein